MRRGTAAKDRSDEHCAFAIVALARADGRSHLRGRLALVGRGLGFDLDVAPMVEARAACQRIEKVSGSSPRPVAIAGDGDCET